jgi:hypothetical protein
MTIARTFAVGLVATLAATLAFAVAFAQEATPEDDVLRRYELATDSLTAAVVALPDDAVEARSALDRAFSALLTLSRGDASALADSLDRVFERARTAIDNRSETDLAVQAQVLAGGFQRLLFEAALVAAVEGNEALARSRLLALADDVDLGEARIAQLQAEAQAGPLRRVFEAGVAEQVAARLELLLDAGAPEDTDGAYRQLARAYADFLLVQDSGRLDPAANERFVDAARGLVDGDDETYLAALGTLTSDLADLRDAADANLPPREDVSDAGGVVADLAGEDPAPSEDGTPVEDAPADEGGEAAEGTAADGEAADAATEEIDLEAFRAEVEAEVRAQVAAELEAQAIADLARELTALGVPATERDAWAADLHAAGVGSVAELEAELATLAAAFEAEVLRGDVVMAQAILDRIETAYGPRRSAVGGTDLAALAFRLAPEADGRLRATIDRLQQAPTLRASDASLLVTEVVTLSDALRGGAAPMLQEAIASTASWWQDWIRPTAMIVLALLALVPLRLLRLAFGGGNANWSLVGLALFLLLLPVYVEGVLAAAALLAGPLAMPGLAGWSVASAFASELTQFVWAAVMLLAVLFAILGLYGICLQFGVVGRGRRTTASPATRARRTSATRDGDETLVDWDDDEF